MIVKSETGREIEITDFEYVADEGVYVTDAYYMDDGRDVEDTVLEELTDRYQRDLMEMAGDIGLAKHCNSFYNEALEDF